jgi:hypothetical protein
MMCNCGMLITKFIAIVGINKHKPRKNDEDEYKKARL